MADPTNFGDNFPTSLVHFSLHDKNLTSFDGSDFVLIRQLCTDDNYFGGSWPNTIGGIASPGAVPGLNLPGRRCQDGRDQDGFRQVRMH